MAWNNERGINIKKQFCYQWQWKQNFISPRDQRRPYCESNRSWTLRSANITADIYNMVDFRGHQLYFQGNGKISLFKGNTRLLEYEEKWLSHVDSKITTDGRWKLTSNKQPFKKCPTPRKLCLLYWSQRKPMQAWSSDTYKNCWNKEELQSRESPYWFNCQLQCSRKGSGFKYRRTWNCHRDWVRKSCEANWKDCWRRELYLHLSCWW